MANQKKKLIKKSHRFKHIKNIKTHDTELLEQLHQRITLYVDHFLVLTEEGDLTQIALAYQKAKDEFLKHAPHMHQIALKIGGDLTIAVDDFLQSIDTVLHQQGALSEDLIMKCYDRAARVNAELKAQIRQ